MPTPIKPQNWRTSQLAEADTTLDQFMGPIQNVRDMLENFEKQCQQGNWEEGLVILQMTNKWILDLQRDMLEFLGVSQEDVTASNHSRTITSQVSYEGMQVANILHRAKETIMRAIDEAARGDWGYASNSVAMAREAIESAERLITKTRDEDPRYQEEPLESPRVASQLPGKYQTREGYFLETDSQTLSIPSVSDQMVKRFTK